MSYQVNQPKDKAMTSFSDIRANAHQGARLLDTASPKWEDKVRIATLSQVSSLFCVLGQVFGNYYVGLDALGLSNDWDKRYLYGFSLNDGDGASWAALTDAWKAEIRARREGSEPVATPKPRKARTRRPRYVQSAEVSVTYAPGQNVSVTKRGETIVKVTTWTTGVPSSTKRH